jgi:hypothetical protein
MNLDNILRTDENKFYHVGSVMNFRTHIIFMCPQGFGKSSYYNFFLNKRTGLFSATGIRTDVRTTFSAESWMGTLLKGENDVIPTQGLFARFRTGIVGADEFARIKNLMDGEGITNEESYLLSALDKGSSTKDLSIGNIELENIGMTFWCGLRPTRLRLTSGLGRRFSFQVFFPNKNDVAEFKASSRSGMSRHISDASKKQIGDETKRIQGYIHEVKELNFSPVEQWIDKNAMIPHVIEEIYKRLAVGYSIVTDTFPELKVDDRLARLFADDFRNRLMINEDPLEEMVHSVLEVEKDGMLESELLWFFKTYYQMDRMEIQMMLKRLKFDKRIDKEGNVWKAMSR